MEQLSHVCFAVSSLFIAPVNYGLQYFEQKCEIPTTTCAVATGWHMDCSQVSQAALFFFCFFPSTPASYDKLSLGLPVSDLCQLRSCKLTVKVVL